MASLLIFADVCNHAHYTPYNHTYFADLIFTDSRLSTKTAKIGPHENFPLYSLLHKFTLSHTHTVTQSLQFMLEVEDDEDWLVSDTAEEEDDNTR
jgi:hypothetical protein